MTQPIHLRLDIYSKHEERGGRNSQHDLSSSERSGAGAYSKCGRVGLLGRASLVAQLVKNLPAMCEIWVQSLGWEDTLEKEKLPSLGFWPREFHIYSPWGHKELDMTEQLSLKMFLKNFCSS